jgi:hypothetical protein
VVLDPFGGTGTVAAIAKRFGRHFVHMDISKKYSSIAAERVAAETQPLLESAQPVETGDQPFDQLFQEKPPVRRFLGRFKKIDPLPR